MQPLAIDDASRTSQHYGLDVGRIVVYSAVHGSRGIVAAEAVVWGFLKVSFDLEVLRTYYPNGMLKAKVGNIKGFAALIVKLLDNKRLYHSTAIEARQLIIRQWRWTKNTVTLQKLICQKL